MSTEAFFQSTHCLENLTYYIKVNLLTWRPSFFLKYLGSLPASAKKGCSLEPSYTGSIVEKITQCLNLNFIVMYLVIDPCICEEKCISSFLSLFLSRPTKGDLVLLLPFFLFPAPPLKIELFHFIIIFLTSPALVHSVTRVTFHSCQDPCRFLCPR